MTESIGSGITVRGEILENEVRLLSYRWPGLLSVRKIPELDRAVVAEAGQQVAGGTGGETADVTSPGHAAAIPPDNRRSLA